jgi:hypothetical protein
MADFKASFARAERERDAEENRRQAWVRAHQAEVEAHNADIVAWQKSCASRHRESVERYLSAVSERVPLPRDLPSVAEIAYSPCGEQVVARVELPSTEAAPLVARYSYMTCSTRTPRRRSST